MLHSADTYFIIGIFGAKKQQLVKAKLVIASLFSFAPEWVCLLHFLPILYYLGNKCLVLLI